MANKIVATSEMENRVAITLSEAVDGIKAMSRGALGNPTDFQKVKTNVIYISFRDLSRQLMEQSSIIAAIRSMRGSSFEYRQLAAFLLNAEAEIVAVEHTAGEVVGDYTYEHDGFTYEVKNIVFSEGTKQMLQEANKRFYSVDNLFD